MRFSKVCFVCFVVGTLLWVRAANALSATLEAHPAPQSQPMLSVETLDGEPISINSLEVDSVVKGPLVVTKVSIGFAPQEETAQLLVRLPQDAVALEWERIVSCSGTDSLPVFASGTWSKTLGTNRASFIYTQPLIRGRAIVANVAQRTPLAHLHATLTTNDGSVATEPLDLADMETATDIVVQMDGISEAYRAGGLAMVKAHTESKCTSPALQDAIIVLDTSSSSAQQLSHSLEQAQALTRVAIGQLALLAFDQSTEVVFNGNAKDFSDVNFKTIANRGALGATNLENTLRSINDLAQKRGFRRVVMFTDGNATAGERSHVGLLSLVWRWPALGIRRLDIVAPKYGSNQELLKTLVTANLPERARIVSDRSDLAAPLEDPSCSDFPISIDGAIEQKPRALATPGPDSEQWILARLAPSNPIRILSHGGAKTLEAEPAWQPLFERYFEGQLLVRQVEEPRRGSFIMTDGKLTYSHSRSRLHHYVCCTTVTGRVPPESIQRIVRLNFGRFRGCARQNPSPILPKGRVTVRFVIGRDGSVVRVDDAGPTVASKGFVRCVLKAFTALRFAPPTDGIITVVYPLVFVDGKEQNDVAADISQISTSEVPKQYASVKVGNYAYSLLPRDVGLEAYEGTFREVMQAIADNKLERAEVIAKTWLERQPRSIFSNLAYGKVAELRGKVTEARRAYGSLLDGFDGDVPLHRIAAAWLVAMGDRASQDLAADALKATFRFSDTRATSERQLAWLHAQVGEYETALEFLTRAYIHQENREASLSNEISALAAMSLAQHPERNTAIKGQLKSSGTPLSTTPNLDFSVEGDTYRGFGLSTYESNKQSRLRVSDRGGQSRGRMGLGFVRIFDYDGHRKLHVELRPFVLQTPGSEVDVGTYGTDLVGSTIEPQP